MFIQNHHQAIPQGLANQFPYLRVLVEKVSITSSSEPDYIIWLGANSHVSYLKEAFKEKTRNHPLWSIDIPPSKSFVA